MESKTYSRRRMVALWCLGILTMSSHHVEYSVLDSLLSACLQAMALSGFLTKFSTLLASKTEVMQENDSSNELLWSYGFQTRLRNRTWIKRLRPNASYDSFTIAIFNRVCGPTNAQAHVCSAISGGMSLSTSPDQSSRHGACSYKQQQ